MKGFRFNPTDEELIEYLLTKTFDPDCSVQIIDQVSDICELEPWELQERSSLQSGDGVCYYMYPPKYKYRNSKLISRTTREGFWKPTGNARPIFSTKTGEEIGSNRTLVFYYNNKNKTCWVMYEYQLNPTDSDQQESFKLCKLMKKKAGISRSKAGQSNQQYSLSNIEKHVANNAITEDVLHPNWSSEPEADGFHNQSSSIETYSVERSYQHNIANEDEGSNLSSNYINHVVDDAIPKESFKLCKLMKQKAGISRSKAGQSNQQYSLSNIEKHVANNAITEGVLHPNRSSEPEADGFHNQSSSIETYYVERSNQHNIVNEDEGSNLSSNYINHVVDDAIPKEPLLHLKEVSTEGNGAKDNNMVQNLYSSIEQDDEYSNSNLTNCDENVPIKRSNQHNMVGVDEGFKWPSNLEYLFNGDLIPTELLYDDGLSLHELLADEPETTNNSNWIQNQHMITNKEDHGHQSLNSTFAVNNEAYLQEGNTQRFLVADNEGFGLPSTGMMTESSYFMEKSRKRPRLQYDGGLNHRVGTGESQPRGGEYSVTPQIGVISIGY